MLVVKPDEPVQGRLQVVRAVVSMRAQHLLQPAVEALHQSVGLQVLGLGQSVLDAERLAQHIELVTTTGVLLAPAKCPVGEFPPVVGRQGLDIERRGFLQRVEERASRCDGMMTKAKGLDRLNPKLNGVQYR